jgi:cytoskeletal protein RodZ
MNENYLWDRTGQPDEELQRLEELLGELRYEPRPLAIPANIRAVRRQRFFPAIAIAATLILFAVAIGLWMNFSRRPTTETARTPKVDQTNAPQPKASVPDVPLEATIKAPIPATTPKRHRGPVRPLVAGNKSRGTEIRQPALTPEEIAQKEQVVLALRMVSAKLNVAQRKTLSAPSVNTIRNQHKIG